MAITLVEAAKQYEDPVQAGIVEHFAKNAPITSRLPLMDITGNAYKWNREESLPGVGFRGVNEAYTESTGVLNPQVESLVIAGGDLDVDKFIVDTMGQAQRTTQELMKVKSLALKLEKTLIKGDSSSDPREFDGLQVRLTGNQIIEAGSTDGGDALSLLKLDELPDIVEGDNSSKIFIMAPTMLRLLSKAARTTSVGGTLNFTTDSFGRRIASWNDIQIVTTGFDNEASAILAFDEVGSGGSTATATSIYCLSTEPGVSALLQNGGIDVRDLGEIDTQPVYRTRVEWYASLALMHGKSAARLRGIKNAAVTA